MRIVMQGETIINTTTSNDDAKLSFAISYMVFLLFLTNAAAFVERMFGVISHQNINLFVWISLFLVLVYNLLAFIRNVSKKTFFFIFFSSLLFLANYLLIGDNENFLNVAGRFFLTVFPIVLVGTSIHNYEVLFEQLTCVSKIILLIATIFIFVSINQSQEYRMGLSYSLQLPAIMMFYNYYKTKAINNIVLAFAGVFIILMLGARGPLLGIFFLIGILTIKTTIIRKNALKTIFYILCILFLIASSDLIFDSLLGFYQSYGIRSRTLFLLTNNALHDSGRSYIYAGIVEEFLNNPFKIHGIASEYAFTGGAYAHNFVLELLFDFGILYGGFVVLYIFYQAFKTLHNFIKRETPTDTINFIMFCCSFFSALVSGTIWVSVYFWLWLLMNKERKILVDKL